jgi:hypothetical protein
MAASRRVSLAVLAFVLALSALLLVVTSGSVRADGPCNGETLISPLYSNDTYLIDMNLNVIRTWHCSNQPAFVAYLLADGSILRPCTYPGGAFYGGGLGGRVQKYSATGTLAWDYVFSTYDRAQHHDAKPMPNGNVMLVAWERKTHAQAVAAGRINCDGEMWPCVFYEIQPQGASGGNIVWEWHLWDHLIQDVDPSKANYGVVGDHPELLDINLVTISGMGGGDWDHMNTVDYSPALDQIIFSSHYLNEFYIVDHSTTTAQAAGHTGGNSGKGGDLLYRWGNPQNYRAGDGDDQVFFVVHGVNWIVPGYPGQGHILAFNNGDRPGTANDYSSVVEIVPPLHGYNYDRVAGQPFGPAVPTWSYSDPGTFYSGHFSGAYRMPNGNTLITAALMNKVFEVTAAGQTVWNYNVGSNIARTLRYNMTATAVDPSLPAPSSDRFQLRTLPNPFSLSTRISFAMDRPGRAQLEIIDLAGRRIATLIDTDLAAGDHETEWNGRDESGRDVATGTYLARLRVNETVEAERLVILR